MPQLAQSAHFDPDAHRGSMIAVRANFDAQQGSWHQHARDQWLHVGAGCLQLWLAHRKILLPEGSCIHIPSGTAHKVDCLHAARFESIWCPPESHQLSLQPCISSPWLRALIQKVTEQALTTDWHQGIPKHLRACLQHELNQLKTIDAFSLPYPLQNRWLVAFEKQPDLSLTELAEKCHVSPRTLRRIFWRETHMSFLTWRQKWRLHQALEGLHSGQSLVEICAVVGFEHESSLSKFVLKHTGKSPKDHKT